MKNLMRFLLTLALALSPCVGAAGQDNATANRKEAENSSASDASPTDNEIAAALKQALEIGSTKAIATAGRSDGFLNNETIRILLPTKLQSVGKAMRLLGEGDTVDDMEIGMNRAAERATPQAKQIFLDAIGKMTIAHPRSILTGGATAATEYFEQNSSADITTVFTPIVHNALQRGGVIKKYDHVIKTAPGGSAIANEFDLDKYVASKTLDGLFYLLGQEEIKIRATPAAQTTPLLKEVFGAK
jgi:hypothetical protein